VRPGVVVTNAHVIAGQDDTTVETEAGTGFGAEAIAFNRRNDVAVLRVAGLTAPPLETRTGAPEGTPVAILGYPGNGPYREAPGRLGRTGPVISVDAFGSGPVQRDMKVFRGRVRSGNSGGPVLDRRGRVVATVFAAATRGPARGFAVPTEVVRPILAGARGPVGTGSCVQ
jgi:S1-C subfamily serine protease